MPGLPHSWQGLADPLALAAFVPGLNFIKAGKTFGQAVLRAGGAGLGYGPASEVRRRALFCCS